MSQCLSVSHLLNYKQMKLHIRSFLLILCSVLFMPANAQNPSVDSLLSVLPEIKGTEKLEILNRLVDLDLYSNPDTASYFAKKLLDEAKKQSNKKYMSIARRGLSICNFYKAEYYRAEEDILKAVQIQEETSDTTGLANSYKILTGIYWETERYDKSIEVSLKALKLYENQNDITGVVSSLNNIGLIYKMTGNIDESLKHYKKALDFEEKHHTGYNKGNLYNNMGISYKAINQLDSSLVYYHKALKEYEKNDLKSGIATGYLNIGNIFIKQNINDSAFYYYNKALTLANNYDKTLLSEIYTGLGNYYLQMHNYKKSINANSKVLSLAVEAGDLEDEKDAHHNLYSLYKATENKEAALFHLERYADLKDSLDIADARVTIENLESKFENEKKQLQIEQLTVKQKADRRIKSLLFTGLGLLLVILILTVAFFIQKRKKATLKRELLKAENEQLEKDVQYKSRQLTSQALMMMQKNRMLGEILESLREMKEIPEQSKQKINKLKQQLKRSIRSEEDWELFRHYFEEINPDFYPKLLELNSKITPSELKLSALIKLNFSIKETAALLNISPDSVKTTRHVLRTKLGLEKGMNIYDYLNKL